jgi:hypothetical protein
MIEIEKIDHILFHIMNDLSGQKVWLFDELSGFE